MQTRDEDHNLLVAELYSLGVKPTVVTWVADFLRERPYSDLPLNKLKSIIFRPSQFYKKQNAQVNKLQTDAFVSNVCHRFNFVCLKNGCSG